IFEQFDLYKHYNIDTSGKQKYYTINNIYNKNVSISRTEFESIEIEVMDTDPLVACNMVNAIIDCYNEKVTGMHRKKYMEVVDIKAYEMEKKKREIDTLKTELAIYNNKYGLLNYDLQVEELTKGFFRLVASGRETSRSLEEIKIVLENIKQKGVEFQEITIKLGAAFSAIVELKKGYDLALQEVEKKITYAQIISSPYPADKKSYPVRWIIVTLSVIAALFFSIIAIGIIESKKNSVEN
ncbi:MAG: hypothetical protein KJ607_06705, partial [Bacteroidetes bacterium]|nr:hypothetical protein [Bacteroidota bacterium]